MNTAGRSIISGGIGLIAVAALGLTGCSPSEEAAEFEDTELEDTEAASTEEAAPGEDIPTDDEADSETTDDAEGTDDADAGDETSEGSAVQTSEGMIDPDDAIHTVEYNIPSSNIEGTMTLGLHYLQVRDNTLELLLTFTPEFDQHDTHTLYALHGNNGALARPALFDRENLKQYSPLRSDRGVAWETDVVGPHVASGETLVFWANFAVPEDDIDTINVGTPAAPEFEDVEIDWGEAEPAEAEGEDE